MEVGTRHFHIVRKSRIFQLNPGHCTIYRSKEFGALCVLIQITKVTCEALDEGIKLENPAIQQLGALPLVFPEG